MKRSLYSILIVLLLAGCSSDLPYQENPVTEEAPLELPGVLVKGNVSTNRTTSLTNGKLGLFLVNGTGYNPTAYCYTNTGGKWTSVAPLMFGPENATVCAWYPYDYYVPTSTAGLGNFPLQAQKYTPEADLVYLSDTNGMNNRNPSLNIQLVHAYALLELNINRDATYKGAGVISTVTLENSNILVGAKFNIRNSSYTALQTTTKFSYDAGVTVPENGTATTGMLMLLFTLRGNTTVKMTVDGKELTGVFQGASLGVLQRGSRYTLHVTIRRLQLSVSALPVDGTTTGEITW